MFVKRVRWGDVRRARGCLRSVFLQCLVEGLTQVGDPARRSRVAAPDGDIISSMQRVPTLPARRTFEPKVLASRCRARGDRNDRTMPSYAKGPAFLWIDLRQEVCLPGQI